MATVAPLGERGAVGEWCDMAFYGEFTHIIGNITTPCTPQSTLDECETTFQRVAVLLTRVTGNIPSVQVDSFLPLPHTSALLALHSLVHVARSDTSKVGKALYGVVRHIPRKNGLTPLIKQVTQPSHEVPIH